MTDINDILDNASQWATESVTKPPIKLGQVYNISMLVRGIITTRVATDDQLVGVMERNAYSINSMEQWTCSIVSTTEDDLDDIVGVVKRIIAEYAQVQGEETYLSWDGGDYQTFNNTRFVFNFVILRSKAMQTEF